MIARIIEWSARNMVLVIIGTLFLTLAFPGFVWRYLVRH